MDNFDLKKFLIENKLTPNSNLLKEENSGNLSWEDFQKEFPQVKDDNLAGEVYSIMQDQNGFENYDDEEIVGFINTAANWTDAGDVAGYFDEEASDIGKLIAGYYQEESGYEGFDDKWDNYLDHLFPQTERRGDDIDDWSIEDGDEPIKYEKDPVSIEDAFPKDPTPAERGEGSVYDVPTVATKLGPNPEGFWFSRDLSRAMSWVEDQLKREKKTNGKMGIFRDEYMIPDKGVSKDDVLSKEQQEEILNTDYWKDLVIPWRDGKLSNEYVYDKYINLYYPLDAF